MLEPDSGLAKDRKQHSNGIAAVSSGAVFGVADAGLAAQHNGHDVYDGCWST